MLKKNLARWVLLALIVGVFGTAMSFACSSDYPGDGSDGPMDDGGGGGAHDVTGSGMGADTMGAGGH